MTEYNKEHVGKFIIVKDLEFTDFMKDEDGNIAIYNNEYYAHIICGIMEFPNVLILEVKYNHIEPERNRPKKIR